MTTLREAAQQALEALEEYQSKGAPFLACDGAVDALRAALAQQDEPVQEPAYKVKVTGRWHEAEPLAAAFNLPDGEHLLYTAPPQRKQVEPLNLSDPAVRKRLATQWGYVPAAPAEPVQEQVAWNWMLDGLPYGRACYGDPPDADLAERAATAGRTVRLLYTAPPQRKLVPLTEAEIEHIGITHQSLRQVARAVERAVWEKNNG